MLRFTIKCTEPSVQYDPAPLPCFFYEGRGVRLTRFRCQAAMDDLPPPLSVMQHTVHGMQGSIINAEQDIGHHDNDVTGQEDDVATGHEDKVDTVAAGGDRGPEGEKEEHVRLSSSVIKFSVGDL
jgi:hypothetical protein